MQKAEKSFSISMCLHWSSKENLKAVVSVNIQATPNLSEYTQKIKTILQPTLLRQVNFLKPDNPSPSRV